MQTPSLTSVKEQLESYRKTGSGRRQPVPDDVINSIKILSKSMSLSKLQRELKLSESVLKRIREPKLAPEVVRLAPINISAPTVALTLEVSSPRGETILVRGLQSIIDLADLIRVLRET
jgi:hypothetical protein